MKKEKKTHTCRVTEKEKKLLHLLRVWDISPEEVARALDMVTKNSWKLERALKEKAI